MDNLNVSFRYNVLPDDPKIIEEIVRSTGFFYEHEIIVANELAKERLIKGFDSGYFFIFAEYKDIVVSYACYGPTPCTKGTYDLYWIVTHNDFRGKGIGVRLLNETIRLIREDNGRLLVAETSTKDQYLPSRKFYEKNNFKCEAIISDFYETDDGKAIFVYRF